MIVFSNIKLYARELLLLINLARREAKERYDFLILMLSHVVRLKLNACLFHGCPNHYFCKTLTFVHNNNI